MSRAFSIRSFWVIILFMGALIMGIDAGFYYGMEYLLRVLAPGTEGSIETLPNLVNILKMFFDSFISWFLPASAGVFVLLGFILWLILKISVSGLFKASTTEKETDAQAGLRKKDPAEQRKEQERKRRLFLHLLSILQREGRLLDFFDEELDQYEDDQIGAAVRSIQEDCKKTIQKYLSPKPVLEGEEGEIVEIEAGFDPDAVKLVGNVKGEPPFKGILRHRGWKAARREVPRLSDVMDSGIIVPAEVELE